MLALVRLLRLTAVAFALAFAPALGGCGGSGDSEDGYEPVFDAVAGLEGEERVAKLRELAREEGNELRLYESLVDKGAKALADGFQRRHGVKVSLFRAGGEDVARRVSQEVKAGRRGADVVDTGGGEMVGLNGEGALVAFEPEAARALPRGAVKEGWVASRFQTYVVAWNTKRVPAAQAPKQIEDLAGPRWRGKIALEAGDADWYKTLREHWVETEGKSEDEADALFDGLARNSRVAPSHAVQAELLGAGDFDAVPSAYLYLARDEIAKGAPIAYEPLAQPVITRPNGVGLVKDAEHPAAAVLFMEWLLGEEAQRILAANNVEPALGGVFRLPGRRVEIDVQAFGAEAQEWNDRYDELLRGREKLPEE